MAIDELFPGTGGDGARLLAFGVLFGEPESYPASRGLYASGCVVLLRLAILRCAYDLAAGSLLPMPREGTFLRGCRAPARLNLGLVCLVPYLVDISQRTKGLPFFLAAHRPWTDEQGRPSPVRESPITLPMGTGLLLSARRRPAIRLTSP